MSVRTTISLPDDLKARMDEVQEPINWSAEAAKCFEKLLGGIAARKQEKDLNDVIARLRASKLTSEDESYEIARNAGVYWAQDLASYPELERAAEFDKDQIGGQWLAPWCGCDWVAFSLLGLDTEVISNNELQEHSDRFWEQVGFEGGSSEVDRMGDNFLFGFLEGAGKVWGEVIDKL